MDWINRELSTGLQKLLCLGLEGQPAAEVITGTLAAWRDVLTANRAFEEVRDVPRFRSAFLCLCARTKRWPVPADFLDAMPRIGFDGVNKKRIVSHTISLKVQNEMEKIAKLLNVSIDRLL